MLKRSLGLLAATALAGALAAVYLVPSAPPAPGEPPADGPRDARAAEPAKRDADSFGYSAAFEAELKKVGFITPAQFAARYPTPAYLGKLSFDPTQAKFFDKLNVETITKPEHKAKGTAPGGKEYEYTVPAEKLSGYKLSPDELAKFKANGFVVSERLGGLSFGEVYYQIYHRDLPVYISSDSVLHAWHRSYDAMLEELELNYLMHALDAILSGMHAALPNANEAYGDGVLKDSVRDADYFLAVARSLLKDGLVSTKLDQDDRLKATLAAVKAEGMHDFNLFGRSRNMDFSQFKPRGHYETNPELRKYFKAMMWCGRTDLRVAGGYDHTGPLSSPRELGAAMVLLDLLRKADGLDAWQKFDRCIQTFVGRTDSATFDDLAGVANAAKIASPADLKAEADLKKLTDAVQASEAGKQDIRGDIYVKPVSGNIVLPRSFTVMGQKFVIDSWVTAKTVYPDITVNGGAVRRRVPSALDVSFAALGNNHVVPNLVERIEKGGHAQRDGKPYQHNLAAARNVLDGIDAKAWDDTIYMQWLATLRTLTAPGDKNLPEVMKTREWALKQTNTQLASWTQLRHDTILYVKQSYSGVPACYYPAGFVEPVVPFWAQMDAMASRSATLLEQTPFPDNVKATQAKQVKFFRDFATQMARIRNVAEKQLTQKELTADEKKVLEDVMQIGSQPFGSGSQPKYTGWYPALFYRGEKDCVKWDALVADVHTDPPAPEHGDAGCVLHQGVGNVDLMIVVIDNGADRVVYLGPTMSHYEFETPNAVRRTDKEWKALLLDGKQPTRPDWTRGYLVPAAEPKKLEAWKKQELLND
jgi:hypothetical protein